MNNTASANYTYDEYGRMASINDVNYDYAATGGMLSSVSRPNNVNTVWSYENNRNLLSSITNNLHNAVDNSDSVISAYSYTNDSLGRRTAMNRSGSVFGANADVLNYSYNDRSEVTGAVSNLLNNYSYGFAFDSIGNRTASVFNGVNTTYTSNVLNQYTAVDSDAPTYDANGNMLTNGTWSYTWNGENRLTKAENSATGVRIEADYDYMGRRIFKKVYNGSTLTKHTRFVYNGYKLIEELDALNSNAVLKQYTWGEVGFDAPVSVYDTADNATYYYQIDGNKNVTELTDASGAVVAHYEYSPFGSVVTATGTYAEDNPFRFSSEYYDPESSLVYYNYRYYSPNLGRWLKPDPIMEKGGWNLYAMVRNNPLTKIDNKGNSILTWFTEGVDLTEATSDPLRRHCLNEGFFRHCRNTCILTRRTGPVVANVAALSAGGDWPNQASADAADAAANMAGTALALSTMNPFKKCSTMCENLFYDLVLSICCKYNYSIRKDNPKCCPPKRG